MVAYLSERDLYVQDLYAGADRRYRLGVRVVTESPWHALFARNMFLLPRRFPEDDEAERFQPGFTVVHAPHFQAEPERDGTRSEVFVASASPAGLSSSWAPSTPGRSRRASSR